MRRITSKPTKKAQEIEKDARNLFQNFNISEPHQLYQFPKPSRKFQYPTFSKDNNISTYTSNDSKKQLID